MSSSAGGEDPSVVPDTSWMDSIAAAKAQANAAQELQALFGLPTYSGTNALGQPYTNQLKPGADFLAKRTAQAAYNEGITNAFTPNGSYMPAWAVQQPAAQWGGARPSAATYFPGIRNVSGGAPGSGTNLGFGTVFGSLAPSTQTPGGGSSYTPPPVVNNGGTYTLPKWEGGFGPGRGSPTVPEWYGGTDDNFTGTAAQSPGIRTFDPATFNVITNSVPDEFKNYYVPWPWQGKPLPVGAFKSLFPTARGNDWSKVAPEGWGPDWRPTGPAYPWS
jgi:hypothetical protein